MPWLGARSHASLRKQDLHIIKVAGSAFMQLAAALAVNVVIMTYVAAPPSMALISLVLAGFLAELVFKAGCYAAGRLNWITLDKEASQYSDQCCYFSQLSLVNCLGNAGPIIALHEVGHYLAALACYRGANPSISVTPFRGGLTLLAGTGEYTFIGKLLGCQGSAALVAGGGVIASTIVAMSGLAMSYFLKDSHPNLSRTLEMGSIVQLVTDVLHGVGEIFESRDGDFSRIYRYAGLPPWITIAIMLILPIAEKLILGCRAFKKG